MLEYIQVVKGKDYLNLQCKTLHRFESYYSNKNFIN